MKHGDLVQISARSPRGPVSRRSFLKVLGTSSALGFAGCAGDAAQQIFPYRQGEVEQIPGVAVWYRSTCAECSCGCGIEVRTREGRAVKIEGNPSNPINRGSLCALGQSSLQNLYDPDRIRQPLKRVGMENGRGIFQPIGWHEAYEQVSKALAGSGKKALLTGELDGAVADLVASWSRDNSVEPVALDPLAPLSLAQATQLVFGRSGIPRYHLDATEVILNFGADLFETFVSPVEQVKDWAKSRRSQSPVLTISVEPRLSLTAASSDLWVCARPGSELQLALYLSKRLLEDGKRGALSDEAAGFIRSIAGHASLERTVQETGIPRENIEKIYSAIANRKTLVTASAFASQALQLQVLSLILSAQLGAAGTALNLTQLRSLQSSPERMDGVLQQMKNRELSVLFVYGVNPAYVLPAASGITDGLSRVPLVVSFSSHRDETSEFAHLILPSHTFLESWGDRRPFAGVYGLLQPVMSPIFDTRGFGDSLLELSARADRPIKLGGVQTKTFAEFLRESWRRIHSASRGPQPDFDKFWMECVERGGFFPGAEVERDVPVAIAPDLGALDFSPPPHDPQLLSLIAYPSVKMYDGRGANRPWLQEIPDPMTRLVWDSWIEIHPETARKLGLEEGDVAGVKRGDELLEIPVYLNQFIDRGSVAVPLGQGHTSFGRYAGKVSGKVNPIAILPADALSPSGFRLGAPVSVDRSRGRASLVNLQGSNIQHGRNLARTAVLGGESEKEEGGEPHGHLDKQFYTQRDHTLYDWGMTIDLSACTGCMACVVACYAENNIPVVGREQCDKGREMSWLRIERYYPEDDRHDGVSFLPMLCQHCHNAPCEPVCPVYATYHNEEGLNAMIYNRCVGTRYCSNNCPYKVRRFNWYEYREPEPLNWQLNPDVVKRSVGVMEKCTFCVQRIAEAKDRAKDLGRPVQDGEISPACVQTCPGEALVFGNLRDPNGRVRKLAENKRAYKVFEEQLNTQPAITYLERVRHKV